jgi:hypothetical protein
MTHTHTQKRGREKKNLLLKVGKRREVARKIVARKKIHPTPHPAVR